MKQYPKAQSLERRFRAIISESAQVDATVFRAVGTEYANQRDLLSGEGTRRHGGRWTPADSFATVHASLDIKTAIAESLGTQRRYGIAVAARLPLTLVAIDVRLPALIDLTDEIVLAGLELTRQRLLRCRWREAMNKGREALTPAIGRIAFALDLEGLLVPSAQSRKGTNLIIFPENLRQVSSLRIQNVEKLLPAED
jgi:RES domain-containing protein